jgi:hypothetical protein
MEDTVKERLISFLSYKKIGQVKFADVVGLSRGFVNNIRNSIQPKTVHRISEYFPDLNTGWLMTGEGEMLKSVVNQSNAKGDNIQGQNVTVTKTETEKFIDLLKTKDEQLNRLIGIIEQLNSK